jgi:hypothetical protein
VVRLVFWVLLGGALLVGYTQNAAPTRPNQTPIAGGSRVNPSASTVNVYDYTTTNPWTALVISTVEEFNAVRPPGAPRLVYVTAPGDAECLDIKNQAVWNLSGIIVCDTLRPEDFPDDPNAPVEGWAGFTEQIDEDTTKIVLNHFVPDGYYLPADVADNTVCHEMMHAYLPGLGDNYDSDVNSCLFGNLPSPGTTDVRLMKQRWPAPVKAPVPESAEEPSLPESVSDVIPDVVIDIPDLSVDIGLPGDESDGVLPATKPTVTPPPASATAVPTASTRSGCDPAYPEPRTCIPPGPPLEFPCAITEERDFIVLPPDPRGLDRDRDGIGCEPIT